MIWFLRLDPQFLAISPTAMTRLAPFSLLLFAFVSSTHTVPALNYVTKTSAALCEKFDGAKCGTALECYVNTGNATLDAEICNIVRDPNMGENFCPTGSQSICEQRCLENFKCFEGESFPLSCPEDAGPIPGNASKCKQGGGQGGTNLSALSDLASYSYCGDTVKITCKYEKGKKCIDDGETSSPPTTTTRSTRTTTTTTTTTTATLNNYDYVNDVYNDDDDETTYNDSCYHHDDCCHHDDCYNHNSSYNYYDD